MGALGHYLEKAGIATTGISLIREHTAAIHPPRALWVPFVLGRPLGIPQDAAFQRRVLRTALGLLDRASGPVLEDYDLDAPAGEPDVAFACPVSFDPGPGDSLAARFEQEISTLRPWYDIGVERRGRTAARLSGLSPEEAARFVTGFIANPALESYRNDLDRGLGLRLATEDIKAFYLESVSAQPGETAAAEANAWFWRDTTASQVFLELRDIALDHPDASVQTFGSKHLVPRMASHIQ